MSYDQELAAAKADSVLQLLFKAARLCNERALQQVREQSGVRVRTAHTALFPHLDLAGTRLTVLAARLGISKQAVSQLVDELEEMGVVARKPDPDDARARLVVFTAKGRRSLLQGLGILKQLETDLVGVIGQRDLARLHENLADIVAWAEQSQESG